ncbi:MAG: M1 family metallopeptidase [Nonlabens ulvanivorans]|uniref:M1 family metallopeptidase n=6 Tax=Nonlabens ulvanivorans TaxID=906888 RepID=UPI003265482C
MKTFFLWSIASLYSIFSIAQDSPSQIDIVDFKTAAVDIYVNENSEIISGTVSYNLTILKDTPSLFIDAKNITRYDVKVDGKPVKADYNEKQIVVESRFRESATHDISIEFSTQPNTALYHIDKDNDGKWDQIWTQGQGKYTSNWLPSIDDMNDKIVWDISITAPSQYQAISNGVLLETTEVDKNRKWQFNMDIPMSSYLIAMVVGNYEVAKKMSASQKQMELYYYPEDLQKIEPTYRHTIKMFDFLEQEIGIEYPWKVYKQIPVKDFLYSGMENTTATIYSDQFVVDDIAFNDGNYVTVNAHEMAHQWFGNLVTETSGKHHWLQEGFATYYSMLAEQEIYGEDHYYMTLFENAESLIAQTKAGRGTALLDPNASSLTFYQHGAWALHALRGEIGDADFKLSVRTYLKQYAGRNVTTDDFLKIVSNTSGKDMSEFKNRWLTNTQFPSAEALQLLRKSNFMEQYFQLAARSISSFDESFNSYKETLKSPVNELLVEEMISQLVLHKKNDRIIELYKEAAATGNVKVRQAIALSLQNYDPALDKLLRTMLNDQSYLTRESALFLLWQGNPMDRPSVLRNAKESWNSMSPSLEMAWNALALNSSDFKNNERYDFLQGISKFTSPEYSPQTRTAAFDYLINLDAMGTQNYRDLIDACFHHSWRFYKNSRDIFEALYKKDESRVLIDRILSTMPDDEQKRIRDLFKV